MHVHRAAWQKLGEVSWTNLEQATDGPSARSGHSIVVANEKAIVFGGCGIYSDEPGAAYSQAVFNESWSVDVVNTDGPLKWTLLDVGGDVPSPRWRHTATLLPDNSMMVFGGLAGWVPLFSSLLRRFTAASPQCTRASRSSTHVFYLTMLPGA